MLIIIPNKCLTCGKDIEHEKGWGEGLVQMSCDVHGFPPFKIEASLSWCCVEHFLDWWKRNLNQLNVTMSKEEAIKEAVKKAPPKRVKR